MKKNIIFCIEHIKINYIDWIFKTLQITLAFIIISYLVQSVFYYYKFEEQIENISNNVNVYVISDRMISNKRLTEIHNNKYKKPLKRLTKEILNFKDVVIINNREYVAVDNKTIKALEVSENFFDKYNINILYAKNDWKKYFKNYDYSIKKWEQSVRPIIAGYNYRKKYDIGDILIDDNNKRYEIIGFLSKNEILSLPLQSPTAKNLNTAIIFPLNVDYDSFRSMRNIIFSAKFFVNDRNELKKIEKINMEEKLLELNIINYEMQMQYVRKDNAEKIILYSTFAIILIVFSLITTILMIIQMVVDYAYEYAVNILCGARLIDIIYRIVMEFLAMILIGIFLTMLMLGVNIGLFLVLILGIIYLFIVVICCVNKINYYDLIYNLRGEIKR